ncbi:hypothetical protein F5884DRAFT_499613 [Xylogone sp. PMI_703]|nr:hypothetical protein F5884DRAFT_499613 [Xylogone sp. PMI_703]
MLLTFRIVIHFSYYFTYCPICLLYPDLLDARWSLSGLVFMTTLLGLLGCLPARSRRQGVTGQTNTVLRAHPKRKAVLAQEGNTPRPSDERQETTQFYCYVFTRLHDYYSPSHVTIAPCLSKSWRVSLRHDLHLFSNNRHAFVSQDGIISRITLQSVCADDDFHYRLSELYSYDRAVKNKSPQQMSKPRANSPGLQS